MDKMEWVFIGLLVFFMMAAAVGVADAIFGDKIVLNKREWVCAKSDDIYMPIVVYGKPVVIVPTVTTQCNEYTRK